MKNKAIKTRQVALTGMLFALAIVLSMLEGFLVPFLGLPPGVKLGLANIVVMYALFFLSRKHALLLVILKAGFGFLTRGFMAGILSFSGGILSFLFMALLLIPKLKSSMLTVSVIGALGHNCGQLLALRIFWGPFSFYYFPVLLVSGVVMGVLTSLMLRVLIEPLKRMGLANHYAPPKEEEA